MIAALAQANQTLQQRTFQARPKPSVTVLRLNGKVRVIGVKEAAEWLHVSQTALRDIATGPEKSKKYSCAFKARVLGEFPQLGEASC